MKAKITPGLILVMVFCASLVAQGRVYRKQRAHQLGFELSRYGTLLKLRVDGKNYGARSLREGYAIGYRVGTDERIAYVYSDQPAVDLSPGDSERQSPNRRFVTTKDGVLRVTSRFSWDNRSGIVTISRDIENVSSQTAELLSVKCLIDNYLAGFDPKKYIPAMALPIKASLTRICAKAPCPSGCDCSTCSICTTALQIVASPGVILRRPKDGPGEISTVVRGPSVPLDQLNDDFDLTFHWTKGMDFVQTKMTTNRIVTIAVEVLLRR